MFYKIYYIYDLNENNKQKISNWKKSQNQILYDLIVLKMAAKVVYFP